MQQRWIDAYNHRSTSEIAQIEADDFHVTFGDGSVQTKTDQLANIRRLMPAGAEYRIGVEALAIYDTWVLQKGSWRVVASHLSNLK